MWAKCLTYRKENRYAYSTGIHDTTLMDKRRSIMD